MTVLPGLDPRALSAWLDRVAPGLRAGPLAVSLMAGGRPNPTYRVQDGVHDWVLRRPPLGHVLPSANNMGREFRVLTARHAAGYEVAEPIAQATDSSVLAAPFYLMAFIEGVALDTPRKLAVLAPGQAGRACRTLVHALGRLHELDATASGLAGFGRSDGFLSRQLTRWTQQWRASRIRPVPGMDDVITALAAAVPSPAGRRSFTATTGCFKIAVIAESIAARHRQGATVGDGFERFVELAPLMIDRARAHLATRQRACR